MTSDTITAAAPPAQTSAPDATDTQSVREGEYQLLSHITAKLVEARELELAAAQKKTDAVIWTRKVWSDFSDSLMTDSNRLPDDVRRSLLDIGLWIERETAKIIDGSTDLDTLIDVNSTIMEGLKPL